MTDLYCRNVDNEIYSIKGVIHEANDKIFLLEYEDRPVIVKRIPISKEQFYFQIQEIYSSVILRDTPHIIPFYGFCVKEDISIYQKPITADLYTYLAEKPDLFTRLRYWPMIFMGCLEGLYYLHRNNIRHDDIATRNVFLDYSPDRHIQNVYIADFGMSHSSIDVVNINNQNENFSPESIILCQSEFRDINKYQLYSASDVWNMQDVFRAYLQGTHYIVELYDPEYPKKRTDKQYMGQFRDLDGRKFKTILFASTYGVAMLNKIKEAIRTEDKNKIPMKMDYYLNMINELTADQINLLDSSYRQSLAKYFRQVPTFQQFYKFTIHIMEQMADANFRTRITITECMDQINQLSRVNNIAVNMINKNLITMNYRMKSLPPWNIIQTCLDLNPQNSLIEVFFTLDMFRRSYPDSSITSATVIIDNVSYPLLLIGCLVINISCLNQYKFKSFEPWLINNSMNMDAIDVVKRILKELQYELYNPYIAKKIQYIYNSMDNNNDKVKAWMLSRGDQYFMSNPVQYW